MSSVLAATKVKIIVDAMCMLAAANLCSRFQSCILLRHDFVAASLELWQRRLPVLETASMRGLRSRVPMKSLSTWDPIPTSRREYRNRRGTLLRIPFPCYSRELGAWGGIRYRRFQRFSYWSVSPNVLCELGLRSDLDVYAVLPGGLFMPLMWCAERANEAWFGGGNLFKESK